MAKKNHNAEAERKLKEWMLSHAAKNQLIKEMMSDMKIIKNRIDNIVSHIEKSINDNVDRCALALIREYIYE